MINVSFLEACRRHSINRETVYIKLHRSLVKVKPTDSMREFLQIANQVYWFANANSVRFYVE